MNKDLITYIENVLHLKKSFCTISHIDKITETMKIWARWVITHRSLFKQGNLYLPDNDDYDHQILFELQDKGVTESYALFLIDWLKTEIRKINSKYDIIATVEYGGFHGNITITSKKTAKYITLTCNGISQKLPHSIYNRLLRLYRSSGSSVYKTYDINYIWLCSTLYSLLDGKGLQWAVPPKIMNILQKDTGCYTELFASPLNSYNDNYYSLFDIDKVFGSKGNFFNAKNSDFIKGTYQVNPPFIDSLFTKTTEKILDLLNIAYKNNNDLTFIYIMPEWQDFQTYYLAIESRFCAKTIFLPAFTHFYYHYDKEIYIRARFGSYIIFLSTDPKCCSYSLESDLRRGFTFRK